MTLRQRLFSHLAISADWDCWLSTYKKDESGYGRIAVGGGKYVRTHRISWQLHRGSIPAGMCVLHKCDVRACINPEHLFTGTAKENYEDARRKKRLTHHKLTDEDVIEIRKLRMNGVFCKDIAVTYGVCAHTIREAIKGISHKHLDGAITIPLRGIVPGQIAPVKPYVSVKKSKTR